MLSEQLAVWPLWQGLESLRELSHPSDADGGSAAWGQSVNPPSIAPSPDVADVTPQPDSSGSSGRQVPRVLTRGGGGASTGRLVANINGLGGGGGSKVPR